MKEITSIDRVIQLAGYKKAVYCSTMKRWLPAAFIQNWQARMVWMFIKRGYFYERD